MPLPQRDSPTEPASCDRSWGHGQQARMTTPVALRWITGDVLARNGSRNSMTRVPLLRGLKHGQSEPSSTVSSNQTISRTLTGWDERRLARSTTDGGITLLPATTVGTTSSMTWWFCPRFPRLSMSPHRPFKPSAAASGRRARSPYRPHQPCWRPSRLLHWPGSLLGATSPLR
jgi:hypothetical protein